MKELHPQKRRLNAIRTIERIAIHAMRTHANKLVTAGAIGGTTHPMSSGENEGDIGVTAGNYIEVNETGDSFEVGVTLEAAGTPGAGKFLKYVSEKVYEWDSVPAYTNYWQRNGTTLSPATAGDEVSANTFKAEVQLRLKGQSSGPTTITGYGDIWGKTDGTLWYSEPWGSISHQIAWVSVITWTLQGDSGSFAVNSGDTAQIAGLPPISTSAATGILSVSHDASGVSAASYKAADITVDSTGHVTAAASSYFTMNCVLDGGGSAIVTGAKYCFMVPCNCTIKEWTLLADQSGSIQIDVWKDTYANYPPTDADSMPGSGKEPKITTATKAQDTDITDWATDDLSAGDIILLNVDSCTSITLATLVLKAVRT